MNTDRQNNQIECRGSVSARQAGEVPERPGAGIDLTKTPRGPEKPRTKAGVWTPRMLNALQWGVKGGRWFALIDKVWNRANLGLAFERVLANEGAPGVDNQTVERFDARRDENLVRLESQLRSGAYAPKPVRRVWIDKPGSAEKRPLGIPTVRDRVVQASLLQMIEPIFEKEFAERSYGFRPGRGCKDALRQVQRLINSGHTWVVDADLKAYFDTIDHSMLLERVGERIADGRVIDLISMFLKQGVMETGGAEIDYAAGGTPQGGVISPLLSNIYLNPLDHLLGQEGFEMVRYADDFVILCKDEASAHNALELVRRWTEENKLTLHPEKTRVVDLQVKNAGFDFLGYHFRLKTRWPRKKSMKKIKHAIHARTKRNNGHSMERIVENVNRTLKGWFEYFRHSKPNTFTDIDGYVRGRLRAILLKRSGRRGIAKGDHQHEWPNAYFHGLGLFSTQRAYEQRIQSAKR